MSLKTLSKVFGMAVNVGKTKNTAANNIIFFTCLLAKTFRTLKPKLEKTHIYFPILSLRQASGVHPTRVMSSSIN